jgi:hypothetical protein
LLSWFATVYVETHVGFTAAYGLILGFMLIASVMLVVGKLYYGVAVLLASLLVPLADYLQLRSLTSATLSLTALGLSSVRVAMALRWHAQILPTSLSSATRLFLGAGSFLTN